MKKRLLAAVLVIVMTFSGAQMAGASTLSKARNQKNEAQNNLDSVNNKISEIQNEQAALQKEINKLDAELVEVLADLEMIEKEIEDKKVELEQAEADLAAAKAREAEQYAAMKERIRFMYENGDNSFLEALMGADDFADVLNKVENFSTVYDFDRNMLVEYQNTKSEVANLVEQVKEEKAELEEIQATYEEEQRNLENLMAKKRSQMSDFDSKLADAKNLAAKYRATIEEQNKIIEQQLAAQRSVSVTAGASSVSGKVNKQSSSSGSKSSGGDYSRAGSGSGSNVANYACQFVGNPYVYGGTSLTNGADCSGFVMSVYAAFGVSLPHSSSALRSVGYGVSASEMQPGDIVCYSGHVAIYIGGGQIVHASTPETGIKISGNVQYRPIVAIRRIF